MHTVSKRVLGVVHMNTLMPGRESDTKAEMQLGMLDTDSETPQECVTDEGRNARWSVTYKVRDARAS